MTLVIQMQGVPGQLLGIVQGRDQEHRVGPGILRPDELHRVDDEVLGDRRQPRGFLAQGQQLVIAVEEVGLHHHGEGRGAVLRVEMRLFHRVEPAVERAQAGGTHLDLGDDCRVLAPQRLEKGVVVQRLAFRQVPRDHADPLPAALGDAHQDVRGRHPRNPLSSSSLPAAAPEARMPRATSTPSSRVGARPAT